MTVCLVQVDFSRHHSEGVLPLGLLHVGSALANAGHPVRIFQCTELDFADAAHEVARLRPLWVGFSVMTGPQVAHSAAMSKLLKSEISAPIVWGGVHPSLLAEQCLEEDYVDLVVVGEGEETAIELTERLAGRKGMEGLPGLAYPAGGKVAFAPRGFIEDLDDERYRLDYSLLDIERYLGRAGTGAYNRVIAYKSSRGCPFRCGFCYNNQFNKRRWRAKSAERVIEDIRLLRRRYGVDGVKFYDDNFYVDRSRALDILRKIGVPAKTDIRIDMVTEDLAAQVKELQVFDLLVGIESGSDRILRLISKGYTVDRLRRGVEILARHNLRVGYSAILGLPTETPEEMGATVDLLLWIHRTHSDKTVTVGPFLPYPGSPMFDLAVREGFTPPPTTEGWGTIDRWSKNLRLPWVRDEGIYRLREYFKFFNYNLPVLSSWAEFRLSRRMTFLPWDIWLVNLLYEQALRDDGKVGRFLRRLHRSLRVQPAQVSGGGGP